MFQVGVLVEQRGERVHVVALEGVDVAREQRLVLVVHRLRSGWSPSTCLAASVARARCSALLTDATVVSSSSATSSAFQRRTSRRMSTARWRGGRCWSAATNASRIDSRATATSAGSPPVGTTRSSGIGSIQVASASGGAERRVGARRRADRSIGRARRWRAAEHVEADVGGDPVQPRPQRRRGPRTGRSRARRGRTSPGRRPRPRRPIRASGSSSRSARRGAARAPVRAQAE